MQVRKDLNPFTEVGMDRISCLSARPDTGYQFEMISSEYTEYRLQVSKRNNTTEKMPYQGVFFIVAKIFSASSNEVETVHRNAERKTRDKREQKENKKRKKKLRVERNLISD